MKCKKIEKWLSDSLDGELSKKKIQVLEEHIKKCALCRSYAKVMENIHKESKSLKMPVVSPAYWEDFSSRLKTKVSSFQPAEKRVGSFFVRWKWVWAGAVSICVIVVGLLLFLARDEISEEAYVFSFESSFSEIFQEIESDHELENLFNSLILASIGEVLEDSEWLVSPNFYEDSFLWENFTEEEMKYLESEIKKDNKL